MITAGSILLFVASKLFLELLRLATIGVTSCSEPHNFNETRRNADVLDFEKGQTNKGPFLQRCTSSMPQLVAIYVVIA